MAELGGIVEFLDADLRVADFRDASHNGLQVAGPRKVTRVCCGVDASMEFFREARRRGAQLLVCHHGLSWGDSLKRITGLNYERIAFLIRNDMALYACHLPLDAHPRYGHNACICRALQLQEIEPFGLYNGVQIGFAGRFPRAVGMDRLQRKAERLFGCVPRVMAFGRDPVRTAAVVSGGAADELAEAGQKGIDVFISGEAKLSAYAAAQEYGINALFAGHYATEVFGVEALAGRIAERFRVEADMVKLNVPF